MTFPITIKRAAKGGCVVSLSSMLPVYLAWLFGFLSGYLPNFEDSDTTAEYIINLVVCVFGATAAFMLQKYMVRRIEDSAIQMNRLNEPNELDEHDQKSE